MNYFISRYEPCAYSPNWYGHKIYAPNATVLMYNDEEGFCIGYMEADDADVKYVTEYHATEWLSYYNDIDNPNIWIGDRLLHRWDEPVVEDGDVNGEI